MQCGQEHPEVEEGEEGEEDAGGRLLRVQRRLQPVRPPPLPRRRGGAAAQRRRHPRGGTMMSLYSSSLIPSDLFFLDIELELNHATDRLRLSGNVIFARSMDDEMICAPLSSP